LVGIDEPSSSAILVIMQPLLAVLPVLTQFAYEQGGAPLAAVRPYRTYRTTAPTFDCTRIANASLPPTNSSLPHCGPGQNSTHIVPIMQASVLALVAIFGFFFCQFVWTSKVQTPPPAVVITPLELARERAIDALPIHTLPSQCDGVEPDDCSICLSSFEEGQTVVTLPCGHRFHHECALLWLRPVPSDIISRGACSPRTSCPLCKRDALKLGDAVWTRTREPEVTAV
jgi:hypothetical protein